MAQSDMFFATKMNALHSTFTNNYLLKHGNIFTKPELPIGNGYSFPFFTADIGGYNSNDNIREIAQNCNVPLNFTIKHEKPPTPPASTSPVATKTPPLPSSEENKNLGLQFAIDDSKNSTWILGKQKLSWDNSTVASYNPETKMFRCVVCNAVGFLSRIAEHYLGTHTSAKVFQCLHCPYSSTWSRCVRMHMAKHHSVPNAPPSLWKGQPLLEEIFQLLTNLKTTVDSQGRDKVDPELSDKKFVCPKCPYTTDRRDLYLRHENIHKEDKPYHCYICFKLFNRADHVKKHFLRIHRGHPYDISLVRRRPPRTTSSYPANVKNPVNEIKPTPTNDNNKNILPTPNAKSANDLPNIKAKDDVNVSPLNLGTGASVPSSKTFECPYCPWEGVDAWCLRRHMNVHVKLFECPICEYKSSKAERLFTHVYKAHMMLVCTKCNFISDQAQHFENHIKECCVEMVVNSPYLKPNSDNTCTGEKKSSDSVLVARDVNLPPIASTSGYFSPYLDQSARFPTNVKEVKGSLSVMPLHNSVSYCFPTQLSMAGLKVDELGVKESIMNTKPPSIESKIEIKTELISPILNTNTTKVTSTVNESTELDLLCFECGCEFADESSLETHSELYHRIHKPGKVSEIPAVTRKRFSCALCNFSSNEQRTILDHMRYHTGETLACKADSSCTFTTIFDATLREHVQEKHSDGKTRCPHCGIRIDRRVEFIRHYRRCHHSTSCYRCKDLKRNFAAMEGESAISSSSSSSSSTCAEIRPYLHHNPYSKTNNAVAPYTSRNSAMAKVAVSIPPPLEMLDENDYSESTTKFGGEKRSRKQSTPRKLVHPSPTTSAKDVPLTEHNAMHCDIGLSRSGTEDLLLRYREKFLKQGRGPFWYCRICYRKPVCYKNHVNYVLHRVWYHSNKKQKCKTCNAAFQHPYQLLIHKRKNHPIVS